MLAVQALGPHECNLIYDEQLEKINSQASFAKEQDQLEMIRILHAAVQVHVLNQGMERSWPFNNYSP